MRQSRFFGLVSGFVFILATVLNGQTTNTLAWDYNDTLANVQSYTQSVVLNGTTQTTAPTCVANGSITSCTLQVTLATGPNTVTINATKGGFTSSTTIAGINTTNAPKNPNNPRIQITTTITLQ